MTGDWSLAADVAQEALIRVYVAWPRLERSGGMAAYARTAVVSASIDLHRKRSRRPEVLVDAHEDARLSSTDGAGERADRTLVMAALRKLPDRQRACVVLRYFEDPPVSTSADGKS